MPTEKIAHKVIETDVLVVGGFCLAHYWPILSISLLGSIVECHII